MKLFCEPLFYERVLRILLTLLYIFDLGNIIYNGYQIQDNPLFKNRNNVYGINEINKFNKFNKINETECIGLWECSISMCKIYQNLDVKLVGITSELNNLDKVSNILIFQINWLISSILIIFHVIFLCFRVKILSTLFYLLTKMTTFVLGLLLCIYILGSYSHPSINIMSIASVMFWMILQILDFHIEILFFFKN